MEKCKECLHKDVCQDFKRNICQNCNDRHNKYRINKDGACDFYTLAGQVEEVKHAKWEINCDGYYPYCSYCKTEPKNGVMSKCCPECGAKMDGK